MSYNQERNLEHLDEAKRAINLAISGLSVVISDDDPGLGDEIIEGAEKAHRLLLEACRRLRR